MSEATRYTIFFVLSFVTFTAWGMITHDLRGTVWYWAAGVLLAGLSEVWFRQVKKISEQHRLPVPVNGVIFNMPVRYLLPKALRQYPVQFGGHRWIAEKP